MMKNILLMLFLVFINLQLFAQGQIKRLNLILLIDGEASIASIFDGYFVIQDSTGKEISQIPFNYKVVGLDFNRADFKKIYSLKYKNTLSIKFTYRRSKPPYPEQIYKSTVWLTKDFMVMHVYNKSKKENFEKYVFGDKDYVVQIETSSWNSIMQYRKEWLQKHESELD